jgi:hypothetical protein
MRGTPRVGHMAILVIALLMAAPASAGCDTRHKEIEAIGVVASVNVDYSGPDTVYSYTFDDGRTFALRYAGHIGTRVPDQGELLIGGNQPDAWVLEGQSDGCPTGSYGLYEMTGRETGTTIELDFGITLEKAPDFTPRAPSLQGRGIGGQNMICVDRQGRVLKIIE